MADTEILLQPEILAELERYQALARRVQVSPQQCQEFNELAKQVAPSTAVPLSTPLRDGSPAAELDATIFALKQEIRTIQQIEAQLSESQMDLLDPIQRDPPSPPSPPLIPPENVKIALYFLGGVVLFVLLLVLLRAFIH